MQPPGQEETGEADFYAIFDQIYATEISCEMRSHFFIAADIDENFVPSRFGVTNERSPAKTASERIGLLILRICVEEMNHLSGILPELHETFAEEK